MTYPNNESERFDLERVHKLETQTTILEKDSIIHTKTLEKIDVLIDKVQTHIEALNRSIYLYEDRLKTQEKVNMGVEKSLKEHDEIIKIRIKEIEEKIDLQEEKRKEFLIETINNLKEDIISHLEPKEEPVEKDNGKFKVFKFLVDNWKYIAFTVAIIGGLMFHKWGLLTTILGLTAGSS